MEELLAVVFTGIILIPFVLPPIGLFMYICDLPGSAVIIYFGWVISCILSIKYFKFKNMKWYIELIIPCLLTICFTIYLDQYRDLFDDNFGLLNVLPVLNLPVIIMIGAMLREKRELRKQNELEESVEITFNEINELKEKIRDKEKVISFLLLLKNCGGNTLDIEKNKFVNNILSIKKEIKDKEALITELENKINKIQH